MHFRDRSHHARSGLLEDRFVALGRARARALLAGGRLDPFAQDYDAVLPGEEFRGVAGVATFPTRIDLSPDVCEPLRLFFRGSYTPYFNTRRYELAEAIVTLAHEAEHLRTPDASEAVVECHALQRARAVVRMAGRRPWYQKEIAALAWQVGYPQRYDDYRTKACRNGGPLDLHPRSRPWP